MYYTFFKKLYDNCNIDFSSEEKVKESHEKFLAAVNHSMESQHIVTEAIFKNLDLDKTKKTEVLTFGEQEFKMHFNTPEEQEIRKQKQAKFINDFTNAHFNLMHKMENVGEIKNGNKRLVRELFGDHFQASEERLQGSNVYKQLVGNELTNEQKVQLFQDYIDEANKQIKPLFKEYKNDDELMENFGKLQEAATLFTVQEGPATFEQITGIKLDKNNPKHKELMDTYEGYHEHFSNFNTYLDKEFARLADPSYVYMDPDSARNLSKALDVTDFFSKYDERVKEIKSDIIPNTYNAPFMDVDNAFTNTELINGDDNTDIFKYIAADKKLNRPGYSYSFIGTNGALPNEEAKGLVNKRNKMGFIDENGNKTIVSYSKDKILKETKYIENRQDKYKEMLSTLNSGTSAFNRSSKEYKNMRNILKKLIKDPKDESKLLQDFKENAEKYKENHQNKEKKSAIANKRMACVEKATEEIDELIDSSVYAKAFEKTEKIMEEKRNKENEAENAMESKGRQNIVLGEAGNSKNSDAKYIDGGAKESQKELNVTKEQEANENTSNKI